jgi:uncharacterized protein (TIGR00255 family)
MRSMTGFGVGEADLPDGRVVVEARSLNHRYLEIRCRLPSEIADQTFYVEQISRARLVRGRFDISVQLERTATPPGLDTARARAVYEALARLRDELAPGTEISVGALAAIPDLFTTQKQPNPDNLRTALSQALDDALSALDAMREQEGTALAAELSSRLERVRGLSIAIEEASPEMVARLARRLKERIDRLLSGGGAEVEPGRLETEIALLADRADITEEIVRLKSHVAQFQSLLGDPEPAGRRMDFLLQEMGRETNTVGAKCQDSALSHLVVELKAELSRMREQVQNVE